MSISRTLVGIVEVFYIYEACIKLLTISHDALIEEAARLMFARDLPFLPVVDDCRLVGVLDEADLFCAFAEMLGGDSNTIRLTIVVPDRCDLDSAVFSATSPLTTILFQVLL